MSNMQKVLELIHKEIGVHEIPGPTENKRILEYHAATKLKAKSEKVAWCAAFASWALQEAGVVGSPHTAWARDFLKFGHPLAEPVPGCIVVFERNGKGGDSHVTFFDHEYKGLLYCLGGNQSDGVNISANGKSRVLGYRGY